MDCLGLMLAAHHLGGQRYDQRPFDVPYTRNWYKRSPSMLRDGLLRLGWYRRRSYFEEFDVLLAAVASHVGDHPMVYVGGGQVLHAIPKRIVLTTIESGKGSYWMDRVKVILSPRLSAS